jgi:hypothetical protein
MLFKCLNGKSQLKEILYMIGNHKALESFQNVIWITSIYMNTGKFWRKVIEIAM